MNFIKKQGVANRLSQIIEEKFNGVLRQYALSAQMTAPTLKNYVDGTSLPGGENLAKLAEAGGVTTDWILLGPKEDLVSEAPAPYLREHYTQEEKEVIEEYRRADDRARATSRMVLRMNLTEPKKVNHPLRRKTDFPKKDAVLG